MASVNGAREKRTRKYLRLFKGAGIRSRRAEDAARMAAMLEGLEPDALEQEPGSVARTRDALLHEHIRMRVEGRKKERARVAVPAWLTVGRVAFAGVAVALVAIAVVLALTLTSGRGQDVARLRIYRGVVKVYPGGGGEPSTATEGMRLRVNDRVETAGDGLAELDLDNGGVARLDGGSALSVAGHGDTGATLRQHRGNVFSNASELRAYTLTFGDVTVSGGGAVFNTDMTGGQVRTRVFDGSAGVSTDGAVETAGGGEEALAGAVSGEAVVAITEMDPGVYSEPWYVWNLELDRSGTRPGQPAMTAPGGDTIILPPPVTPDASAPDGTTTSPTTPTGTTPTTSPSSTTTPQENVSLAVVLDSRAAPGWAMLSWSVTGSGSYNSVAVLRTQSNKSPVYPADQRALVAANASGFTDTNVTPGATYTYRVCLLKGGNVLAYSNVVTVQVPPGSSTEGSQ